MHGTFGLPRLGDGGSSPSPPTALDPLAIPALKSEERRVTVLLNVYSLIDSNKTLGKIGMGVFHSGIVLYGIEWGYGECPGHPEATGLFLTRPGTACGTLFRTVNLGVTTVSPEDVDVILHQLEREWRGGDYHILNHNCNHFAQTLCDCLSTVELLELPAWCNRAARVTNRVVPRRLATRLKNMMDPPDAKEKYLVSTSTARSVIPPEWYKHPTACRPPKNVPRREREARRITHNHASRSFTYISLAFDDMGSVRTEDGFYLSEDETGSCCGRVMPLASVELQPQLLDQLRLRRRGSLISMSTDRLSLHSVELVMRKEGLGPRGRGGRTGGRGSGGGPLTRETSTAGKPLSARRRGRCFAAPPEAAMRREGLSTVQVVEARDSMKARQSSRRSTVDIKTPTSTTKGARAAMNTSSTSANHGNATALTAQQVVRLSDQLAGAAGPTLDSPPLSDISDPVEDDVVEMGSSPTMPTESDHNRVADAPVSRHARSQGTETEVSLTDNHGEEVHAVDESRHVKAEVSSDSARKETGDEQYADDLEDDSDDDFPFLRHLDPSTLAGPVGILMIEKSRCRAQSMQERKGLLLRAVNGVSVKEASTGTVGLDKTTPESDDETKAMAARGETLGDDQVLRPPVESARIEEPRNDNNEGEAVPALVVTPPRAAATSSATSPNATRDRQETAKDMQKEHEGVEEATEESIAVSKDMPVGEAARLRSVSDTTPDATDRGHCSPRLQNSPHPRRHTITGRSDVMSPKSLDVLALTARQTAASSLPVRPRVSTTQVAPSKVFHLPPMTGLVAVAGTKYAEEAEEEEEEEGASSGGSGGGESPSKVPFEIQSLANTEFTRLMHAPPGTAPVRNPRRVSVPSLTSQKPEPAFPSPPSPTAAGQKEKAEKRQETTTRSTVYPLQPQVIRQKSLNYSIGVETSGTPMSLTPRQPKPLYLVEKASS